MENTASLDDGGVEGPTKPRGLLGGRPWHLETPVSKSPGFRGLTQASSPTGSEPPHSGILQNQPFPRSKGSRCTIYRPQGRLAHHRLPILGMELAVHLTGPLEHGTLEHGA